MKTVVITAIKPQTGQIEYGIQQAGEWVSHGHVFSASLAPATTVGELQVAAEADAQARGLL